MYEHNSIVSQSPVIQPVSKDAAFSQHTANENICTESFYHFPLQRKLSVGAIDDPLEDEADNMADKVMRMPEPNFIQRKCADCEEEEKAQRKPLESFIQKKCAACEQEERAQRKPLASFIQKKETSTNNNVVASNNVSNQIQSTKGSGNVMPETTKSFMESRFGTDFSSVKIHTGNYASQLSKELSAQAFTVGNDIYFNEGKYQPESSEGKHLLAHELMHTIQQNKKAVFAKSIRRELNDPLDIIAGYTEQTVSSIVIDRGSGRTRFFTKGGIHYDGIIKSVARRFASGEYLLRKSNSKDPNRTWDIYKTDNSKYRGGMQFDVYFKDLIFSSITYSDPVQLTVGENLLERLIDLNDRLKEISKIASQFRVNKDDEQKIIALLNNIPTDQAKEFYDKLLQHTVDGKNLLELLDSVIDTDENMTLHETLSKIKLQAKKEKGAKALAEAPILAWHDVMGFFEQSATFKIDRMPNGKIKITYMGAVSGGLYNKPEYKEIADMDRSTRLNWMAGGVEVDPDQAIIIHDYDRDKFVVVTAENLIGYQHAGTRKFIEDVLTVASFATPVGGETAVGRAIVITMEKVLPALVLLVEENKLNIRKWFPNWGPAIINATEVVKIGLAIYGVTQFVKGGWAAFAKLRQMRNARKAMDAAIVAENASEISQAEKIAVQLEKQADGLLEPAEKLKQELKQADVAAGKSVTAVEETASEIKTASTVTSNDLLKYKKANLFEGITDDTKTLFATEEGKKLKVLLEANPEVALLVKLCKSPCFPKLNEKQVSRIKTLMRKADIHGIELNEEAMKQALHQKSSKEIDDILEILEGGLQQKIEARPATLPTGVSTMESAEQIRNMPGIASNAKRLPSIKGRWIHDGKIGQFPRQIAEKMEGITFKNFKSFRETFWKLVAADADLTPLGAKGESLFWSESNFKKMKKGEAPVVTSFTGANKHGKITFELDHRLALKNEGGVYDMSNIDIVHKEFHELIGEK